MLFMIDENAFGMWVSYHDVENDEYALERDEFVARVDEFRALLIDCLSTFPLGRNVRAVDFGHGLYVEVADGDQVEDPIVWLKMVRARLTGRQFRTVGVLSHGSRWVADQGPPAVGPAGPDATLTSVSLPSEPLRRALYADAAARYDEEDAPEGWGPGLYIDVEAVEALGKSFKNEPTPLLASGAMFFRVGQ